MAGQTTNYIAKLTAVDNASATVKRVDSSFNSLTKGLGRIATAAGIAGAALGSMVSVSLLKNATKQFAAFEDQMLKVAAVSGATGKQYDELTKKALNLGSTTRYTAQQAAEGMTFLSMAGFDATQTLAAIPEVLNLAQASATDLGDTADIVTNIMTGFGVEVENLQGASNVLTQTFTRSNSTLTSLGTAFSYVGPVAKSAGLQFNEVSAILGKLHDAGIQGTRAGTALRGALTRLLKPTAGAQETLAKLGVTVLDATGEMRPFLEIMGELEKAGASTADMISVFGQRAGTGMVALLGQGIDSIKEFEQSLDETTNTTEKIAEQMESGLGGALRKLNSNFETTLINLGKALAPTVNKILGDLGSIIDSFESEMIPKIQTTFKAFASNAAGAVAGFSDLLGVGLDLLNFFRPFIVVLGDSLDELLLLAVTVKSISVAMGIYNGLMALATTGMGAYTVQTAAGATATSVLTANLRAANGVLGVTKVLLGTVAAVGAAAFIGWKIGKVIGEMKLLNNGTKTLNEGIQDLLANATKQEEAFEKQAASLQGTLKFLQKWRDFKLPDNFELLPQTKIDEVQKRLKQAKLYWEVYAKDTQNQADAIASRLGTSSDAYKQLIKAVEQAKNKAKEYGEQIKQVGKAEEIRTENSLASIKSLISAVESQYNVLIEAAKNNMQERMDLIKESMRQEIESTEATGSEKAAIIAKYDEQIKQTQEDFSQQRIAIQKQAQEEIAKSYGEGTAEFKKTVDDLASYEIKVEEEKLKKRLDLLKQSFNEGKLLDTEYNQTREDLIRAHENVVFAIKEEARNKTLKQFKQIVEEETKVRQKSIDTLKSSFEQEIQDQENVRDQRLAIVEQMENEITDTAFENQQQRTKIQEDYISGVIDSNKRLATELENYYLEDLENKKKVLDAKAEAERESLNTALEITDNYIKEIEKRYTKEIKTKQKAGQELTKEEQKVVEAYKEATEERQKINQQLTDFEIKQANQRKQLESEVAQAKVEAQKEAYAETKSLLSLQADEEAFEIKQRIAHIDELEQEGVYNAAEAANEKKLIEQEWAQFKVEQAEAAVNASIQAYGRDSEEYRRAVLGKKEADLNLESSNEALEKSYEALENSANNTSDSIDNTADSMEKQARSGGAATHAINAYGESLDKVLDSFQRSRETASGLGIGFFGAVNVDQETQTLEEINNVLDSNYKTMNQVISSAHGLGQSYQMLAAEINRSGEQIVDQFNALEQKANAAGIAIDLTGYTLEQATQIVDEKIEAWNQYNQALQETGAAFNDVVNGVNNSLEATVRFSEVGNRIGDVQARASSLQAEIQEVKNAFDNLETGEAQAEADELLNKYEELITEAENLKKIESAFKDLSLEAQQAGLNIDLTGYSLEQASVIVESKIEKWNAFKDSVQGIIGKFDELNAKEVNFEGVNFENVSLAMNDLGNIAHSLEEQMINLKTQFENGNEDLAAERGKQLAEAYEEIYQKAKKLKEIEDAFQVLTEKTRELGIEIDFTGMTLEQAEKAFEKAEERIKGITKEFENFKTSLVSITEDIANTANSFTLIEEAGNSFPITEEKVESLKENIILLNEEMRNGTVEDAKKMADSVIESYKKIYEDSAEYLKDLKGEWNEYYDKVQEINDKIAEINMSTEERIRELRRDTMTEEERWQDQRLEYEEVYAEAVRQQSLGNFEAAVKLFEEAQNIASDLATTIKNESGEVVSSLEQNTTLSIGLIEQARDAATSALNEQQSKISENQNRITEEINKTKDAMNGFANEMNSVNTDFQIDFWGSGSSVKPIMNKISEIETGILGVRQKGDQPIQVGMDFLGRVTGNEGLPVLDAIGKISGAVKGFKNYAESSPITVSLDTSDAEQKIKKLKEDLANVEASTSSSSTTKDKTKEKFATGFALGGFTGFGTPNKDSINAKLAPWEYVQPYKAVKTYGIDFMENLRNTSIPVESVKALMNGVNSKTKNLSVNVTRRYKDGGAVLPSESVPTMAKFELSIGSTKLEAITKKDLLDELNKAIRTEQKRRTKGI